MFAIRFLTVGEFTAKLKRIKLMELQLIDMRRCVVCGLSKPLYNYAKNSNRKDGIESVCKECVNYRQKQNYLIRKEKYNNLPVSFLDKKCGRCFLVKSITEFTKNPSNAGGWNTVCKKCILEQRRMYKFGSGNPLIKCKKCGELHRPDNLKKIYCQSCEAASSGKKICSMCREVKDLSLFYKDKREAFGVKVQCKKCLSEYKKLKKHGTKTPERNCLICNTVIKNATMNKLYCDGCRIIHTKKLSLKYKTSEKGVEYARIRSSRLITSLNDQYIKNILMNETKLGLSRSDIPKEMIETKRLILQIKRELRK